MTKKRILILGGGLGGVYVAVHLRKMLSVRELATTGIALVNHDNYIAFQPLLPEVISGSVELNHVIAPIRRMAPRANLYTRDIESIDPVGRTVTLSPGIRPTTLTLSYDHLVIAMGTRLDHSKIPGMRERASPFKYRATRCSTQSARPDARGSGGGKRSRKPRAPAHLCGGRRRIFGHRMHRRDERFSARGCLRLPQHHRRRSALDITATRRTDSP